MRYSHAYLSSRVLSNPQAVAERLAVWSEDARRAGRVERADQLLLAAWEAFETPAVADVLSGPTPWHPGAANRLNQAA